MEVADIHRGLVKLSRSREIQSLFQDELSISKHARTWGGAMYVAVQVYASLNQRRGTERVRTASWPFGSSLGVARLPQAPLALAHST